MAVHSDTIRNTTLNFPWFEHTDDRLTEHGQQCPYVRPERREIQLIKRLQQFVPDALPVVRKASWHCETMSPRLLWGAVLHTLPDRRIQYSPGQLRRKYANSELLYGE
ncbi:hypothetical protein HT118_14865 [Escherichia coli]|nr:hypothetical protein [Escherichia coli]